MKDRISEIHEGELIDLSLDSKVNLTWTFVDASLGKPFLKTPTSDVVPPMSITMAFFLPERNAAPRMLFVGPDANVLTGYSTQSPELKERRLLGIYMDVEKRHQNIDSLISAVPGLLQVNLGFLSWHLSRTQCRFPREAPLSTYIT
jgi:hypothetical protein